MKSPDPHFAHLPDAQGPEWAALGILVATLVIFGVAPWIAVGTIDTATSALVASLPKVANAVAGVVR
jgi:NADH:ubiquinone oxidoreductase subunit 4 (subunit M)